MDEPTPTVQWRDTHPQDRDGGSTFVELLVAIVLLGTVAIAVLATFRVTITGTRLERDHSRALQWLQSAAAVVQGTNRESCVLDPVLDTGYGTGEEKVRTKYEYAIRAQVENPPGWDSDQLRVVPPVKVWDGSQFLDPATAPQPCYDAANKRLQLITIEVTDGSGQIIESMDIVKSEGGEATP